MNVKLFLEGEEEVGSPSLPTIVARYGILLQADAMLSADGGRVSATITTINVGARGNTGFEFRLITAAKDLHSDKYGGAVRNALHEMAKLVAGLHGEAGRIAVAGYLDSIRLGQHALWVASNGPRERRRAPSSIAYRPWAALFRREASGTSA